MPLRPLNQQVLIERDPPSEETSSGLFIPEVAQRDAETGTVRAIGPKADPAVQVGDRVLFQPWNVREVTVDGEKLVIIEEDRILGVF